MNITANDYNAKYLIGESVLYSSESGVDPELTKTRTLALDYMGKPSLMIECCTGFVPLTSIEVVEA